MSWIRDSTLSSTIDCEHDSSCHYSRIRESTSQLQRGPKSFSSGGYMTFPRQYRGCHPIVEGIASTRALACQTGSARGSPSARPKRSLRRSIQQVRTSFFVCFFSILGHDETLVSSSLVGSKGRGTEPLASASGFNVARQEVPSH